MFKKPLPISLTFAINGANKTRRSTLELSDSRAGRESGSGQRAWEPAESVGVGRESGRGQRRSSEAETAAAWALTFKELPQGLVLI